jgi:hypothetical protein
MPAHEDSNPWLRSSRYFIEGEDAAREGRSLSDCRYVRGSIAFSEWMAGFKEASGKKLTLTEAMRIDRA